MKKRTRAEKLAANLDRDGRGGPGRAPKFRQVDTYPVRVYIHLYAAIKRLSAEEGRTISDIGSELVRLGLAAKLQIRAEDIPGGEL